MPCKHGFKQPDPARYGHEAAAGLCAEAGLAVQTIENSRVKDDTMVEAEDPVLLADFADDEFAGECHKKNHVYQAHTSCVSCWQPRACSQLIAYTTPTTRLCTFSNSVALSVQAPAQLPRNA